MFIMYNYVYSFKLLLVIIIKFKLYQLKSTSGGFSGAPSGTLEFDVQKCRHITMLAIMGLGKMD